MQGYLKFNSLSSFYMYKARKSQRKDEPIETNLSWLLSKSGQEFVTKAVWRFGQPSFRLTQVVT